MYFLAWEPFDVSSPALVFHPEQMRGYLNGDITIDQFAGKVTAYGP